MRLYVCFQIKVPCIDEIIRLLPNKSTLHRWDYTSASNTKYTSSRNYYCYGELYLGYLRLLVFGDLFQFLGDLSYVFFVEDTLYIFVLLFFDIWRCWRLEKLLSFGSCYIWLVWRRNNLYSYIFTWLGLVWTDSFCGLYIFWACSWFSRLARACFCTWI